MAPQISFQGITHQASFTLHFDLPRREQVSGGFQGERPLTNVCYFL